MKILIIAPLHREKEYYSQKIKTPFHPYQGQQSWVDALEHLGHTVEVFRSNSSELLPHGLSLRLIEIMQKIAPRLFLRYMNARNKLYNFVPANYIKNVRLFAIANKFRPQIILLSGGTTEIFPSVVNRIKRNYGSRVYLMSGVNPEYAATKTEKIMIDQKIIDIVVENDEGYVKKWKRIGAKKTVVLPISSVDPKLHRVVKLTIKEQKEYACDVCFVGTLTVDRQKKLANLLDFDVKVWGDIPPGVKLNKALMPYYYGTAFGDRMVKIFNAAKVVLNFQPGDMIHGGNMRTFEIAGCCAFQLADKIDVKLFKEGREYVNFKDVRDLKRKITYYLQNENQRITIATAGFRRAYKYHTYEEHFKKLLSEN